MKLRHAFLLTAAAVILLSGKAAFALSANVWYSNASGYEEIYEGAKNEEKPFLLLFHVDWCGYCKRLKSDLLDNSKVQQFLSSYYRVKINPEDGEKEKLIAMKYGVSGYPNFRVVFPDGGSVRVHPFKNGGIYTPDEFIAKLEAALAGKN
ncbi:MAG: thioredoxin family protein [Candidatus Electronema sp. V4]|uniref:thioredoxin family protein n=1 Tax=Candidatus Electronema sp. V4 TaxID=3454756 RepID=UPI00405589BE